MALTFHIILLAALVAASPIKSLQHNPTTTAKLPSDDSPPIDQIKCGGCPCNNPCYTTPPPPPPSPPPPKMIIPTPLTPGLNCPPPPIGGGSGLASPGYTYITGPPGDVYPVNPYFSGSRRKFGVAPPVLVVCIGVVGLLIV